MFSRAGEYVLSNALQRGKSIGNTVANRFAESLNSRLQNLSSEDAEFIQGESKVHQVGLSANPLPPEGYGGIELIITNLTRGLVEHDVPVICYAPPPFGIKGAQHVETIATATPGPNEGKPANSRAHLTAVVDEIVQRYEPGDIVHFHHLEQYPRVNWRVKLKRPFTNFNFIESSHWTSVGMGFNIVYPSKSNKVQIGKPGRVIRLSYDPEVFFPATDSGEQNEYLLYAGRISQDKGVKIAADAAKSYNIPLRMTGPVVEKKYASSFLDYDVVDYRGTVPRHKLADFYRESLAVVYMTQYNEPGATGVIEALASGTPVITTGRGATGELVEDGDTGVFCETAEDIVSAIDKVRDISRKRCAKVGSQYSYDKIASQYLAYYNDLFKIDAR